MANSLSVSFTERVRTYGLSWAKDEPYRAAMVGDKIVKVIAYSGLVGLAIAARFGHEGIGKFLSQHMSSSSGVRFTFWAVRLGINDWKYLGKLKSTWSMGGTEKTPNKLGSLTLAFLVAFEFCNVSSGALNAINFFKPSAELARAAQMMGKATSITLFSLLVTDLADSTNQRYINAGKKVKTEADKITSRKQVSSDVENMLEIVNFAVEEGMTKFPGMEWVGYGTGLASAFFNFAQRKYEFDLFVLKA